jgi:four helix bundle protein
MATRFEDLLVWQKARELIHRVYQLTRQRVFNGDQALRDQMRRAAVSVMSNIAEGYERGTDAELARFLSKMLWAFAGRVAPRSKTRAAP